MRRYDASKRSKTILLHFPMQAYTTFPDDVYGKWSLDYGRCSNDRWYKRYEKEGGGCGIVLKVIAMPVDGC